jgi:DNA-binding NarL/FixJ family response regulator
VEALVAAIREVHGGGMPFSIGVARRVSEHFRALPPSAPEEDRLSPREVDVLGGLARGRLLKEVAVELGVSEHTVKTYLKRIYAKLKVRSSRAAVARFLGR